MNTHETYEPGTIYLCDFGDGVGSEQKGVRPCIIVSNSINNMYSSNVTVLSVTGRLNKCKLPVHVLLSSSKYNIPKDSVVQGEMIRSISKERLIHKIDQLDDEDMQKINNAMMMQLGLVPLPKPQQRTQQTTKRTFVPPVPIPTQQPMVAFA